MANTPDTFERQVNIGRPVRVLLGALVLAGAILFALLAAILFTSDRTQMPSPRGALELVFFFGALALGFAFVGVRLISMKAATEKLFSPRAAIVAGPVVCAVGIVTIISAIYIGPTDAVLAGILFVVVGCWIFWSGRWRK